MNPGAVSRAVDAPLINGRVVRWLAVLLGTALLFGCCQTAAASVQVTSASAVFPQRALVVSGTGLQGLSPNRIHILENGAPVPSVTIRPLTQPSAHDFGVVLVIDVSPNVRSIEQAVTAARVLAARRPAEENFGLVLADAVPAVALPLTRDAASINAALATPPVISRHGLHVYDAALAGLGMLRSANIAAGSVIVLSDGADRGDAAALSQVSSVASSGHIKIYAVGVDSPRFDPETLTALAGVSGGQFVKAGSAQLSQIFGAIQTQLSSEYLIRYYSRQPTGKLIASSMRIDGVPGRFDITYSSPAVFATRSTPIVGRPSIWTSTVGALLVSMVSAALIGVAVLLLIRRREDVGERVGNFITRAVPTPAKHRTLVHRALGDPRLRRGENLRWLEVLALEFDVAHINISPGRLIIMTVAGTFILGWLLVSATTSAAAVILALVLPVGVRFGIRFLANRQRRHFDEQLPDNLQIIASALRAGHTFIGSLGVMVEDAPEPSRRELRRALADEQLGVPLVDALKQVSMRMKSIDFEQVTLVATLQRDTGGNTAEVIDLVADTIRDRLDLRRMVRALTAQGRLAGAMLSGLPVVLLIAISLINPSYVHPLFHAAAGIIALACAAMMISGGYLIIRRIVNIEI